MRGKRLALAMMMACAPAAIDAPLHAQAAPAETLEIDKKRIDAALAAMIADGRAAGTSALIWQRSEEHTSELQSLMRISYAVFCLKKKTPNKCCRPNQVSTHHIQSSTINCT